MIRGTTPLNIFTVDEDLTNADVIYITYKQNNNVAIEKSLPDIQVTSDTLTVRLTQEDTLNLEPREVSIQIRARFADGTAIASNVIQTTATKVLKDGVI